MHNEALKWQHPKDPVSYIQFTGIDSWRMAKRYVEMSFRDAIGVLKYRCCDYFTEITVHGSHGSCRAQVLQIPWDIRVLVWVDYDQLYSLT